MASRAPTANGRRTSLAEARAALAARLRDRLPELEAAVATRVYSVSQPRETADPTYLEGLRESLRTSLDYAFLAIELGEQRAPDIPPSLFAQARLAARNSVTLDTVLRRYFAGYSLLTEFVIQEAEDGGLVGGSALQSLLRGQASLFDRLIAAVSEEYARESSERLSTSEQRRAERIERLLAGEPLDTSQLSYDLEGFHLGAVASGPGVEEALRSLTTSLDANLLVVRRDDAIVWAWFGRRRALDPAELLRLTGVSWPANTWLAIGEPGEGVADWRLTHRQAKAALPVALRGHSPIVRYAEVALLAAVLEDDLLASSLHQLFVEPLESERDGGEVARATLRTYFAAENNITSAAAALGVNRNTVANRLRAVEGRIGRSLALCGPELEVALRLGELGAPASTSNLPANR